MQFLRDEFTDQLRAEVDETTGNVVIEAANFTPQQILEFNDDTFEMAFEEWKSVRKDQYLEKADQILSMYDNSDRFEKLKQAYQRGSVLPFIGAGLSMPSGYPSWTDYLYRLCRETTVSEEDLTALISNGQYEEAAQLLFDAMPHDTFNEHLENKFDTDRPLVGCVRSLPYCFKSSVITTNFDNVLKRCYDEAECAFDEVLLGPEATELPKLIGQNKNVLVKLHGKANTARSRVLTEQEYNHNYNDDHTLENCMEAICKKTLLFIGCSLSTDRTVSCLKGFLAQNGAEATMRHYAFISIGDDNDARLARRDELAEANIFPIWYPADEDHDECLIALLEKLKEDEV